MSDGPELVELGGSALLEAILRAVDNGHVGLTVTQIDVEPPRLLYVNRRTEELLGRTREELMGVGVWGCLPPQALSELRERHQRVLADGSPRRTFFETVALRPDGGLVPVEVAQSEATIGERKVAVSFVFDLSDRQRALAALAESERRFRRVVEDAPDGVAILRGPRIVFLNKRAATMLGLEQPEDGYGRLITELLHPDDAQLASDRIRTLLTDRKPFREPAEYRSRALDGSERVVEISSIPVDLDGAPAVVAFARDVTERKAIQARLAQADRLSALGVLSAGVAHEINNPLAYVLLNLQCIERELGALADGPALASLKSRVRDARHGAERVANIVRDLHTFARGDEAARAPVDLATVIESALSITQPEVQPRARIVRALGDVPPVDGNASRLEQVLVNLLLNAAQAIAPGAPEQNTIGIALRLESGRVCVDISDTGAGISDAVRRRMFDPFFTTKPPGVGTGLGLPICQSIVRALGGEISVTSSLGRGSTFTVALPPWNEESGALRSWSAD